ncbi:hypothetical protein Mhypo_02793 [Meiothermus hypogaeus]|uniref:Uncharacterized protein n=1 Tax=Meiothermus hypogaeus TaxID=884155 RepID=A0ABX9MJR0_9DEIN|nr:hypothetical protein Mhypo_02793 [Meiothermus hypogaeus]
MPHKANGAVPGVRERLQPLQAQLAGQHRIVPHLGMGVERQMGRIKANTCRKKPLQPPLLVTHNGKGLPPEKPMMGNQKVYLGLCRLVEDHLGRVHRDPNFSYFGFPLHLQAVERGIFELAYFEVVVQPTNQHVALHGSSLSHPVFTQS